MNGDLPHGVVTFLMTDVEDSTRIWRSTPHARAAMGRQAELIDAAIARYRGVRPSDQGEGDSAFAAFVAPAHALAAALDAQRALATERWPDGVAVRVRMAVLTAEAELRDARNYGGLAPIRCARLRDLSRGGQVLVAGTTADLAADRLPDGATLVELGSVELPGFARRERVLQLCHPELPACPAELRGGKRTLPEWPTPLVGRAAELHEVAELLGAHRLVTLTGAGGSGKTRLAHAVAGALASRFADGVVWVELGRVASGEQVAPAVVAACSVQEGAGIPPLEVLAHGLAHQELLLVLDNCEHVLAAAAETCDAVLRAAPSLHLLATSREPLGVTGEVSWRVPSLVLPAEEESDPERIAQSDAVALFMARARAARPDCALDAATAPVVARICRRLDGIPLALELAAARVRATSLERLADGLHDRFRLLTGGARTAVARQRTLLASVQWSHDLLDDDERTLFRRLAVFAAPFTLDAAEAVAADGHLDRLRVFELLARLVDKSLVQHAGDRYRLLETLRQYAQDRADDAGELAVLRDRHRAFYVRRASDLRLDRKIASASLLVEIAAELPDLLAALDWSLARPDGPSPVLLAALCQYWIDGNRFAEARAAAERVLGSLTPGSRTWLEMVAQLASVLVLAGDVAWLPDAKRALDRGDVDLDPEARALLESDVATALPVLGGPLPFPVLEQVIERSRALGNRRLEMKATYTLGAVLAHAGYLPRARPLLAWVDQHLARDAWLRTMVEISQALVTALCGDLHTAWQLAAPRFERSDHSGIAAVVGRIGFWTGDTELLLRARRKLDAPASPGSISSSVADEIRGLVALRRGELDAAATSFERAWIFVGGRGMQRFALAEVALARGDLAAAERWLAEAEAEPDGSAQLPALRTQADLVRARLLRATGELVRGEAAAHEALATASAQGLALATTDALETLALFAAERGDAVEAARRLGAAEAFRARSGYRWRILDLQPALAQLFPSLDPSALREGSELSLDEAVARAQRGRGARSRPGYGWDALTPTELRVVELVAVGLSNQEIAARLFVSLATVKSHLVHVFQKLDVRSRAELAVAAARRKGCP